jgi:hypothetical protein
LGIFMRRASGSVVLTRGWRLRTFSRPPLRFGLLLLELRQLRHRLLQTLQPLLGSFLASRLLPRAQLRSHAAIDLLAQLCDMLPGLSQQLRQTLFTTEAARSRAYPHPHSILADTAHRNHVLVHQRCNYLRK